MKTVFLRALEELSDKDAALRRAILGTTALLGNQRFEVDVSSFVSIPGAPFAYWVSDQLRGLFTRLQACESASRAARQGLVTADDFRFVRAWWGVSPTLTGCRWFGFAKGGSYSPFYSDVYLVVNWEADGKQIANLYRPGSDRPASRPQNIEFFFRPGVTWPRRTKSELSMRAMPAGCVFADKGPALILRDDDYRDLMSLLAIGTSKMFRALVEIQLAAADAKPGGAAHSYEVGVVQRTPLPELESTPREALAELARRAWSLKRSSDRHVETSHAFTLPALLWIVGGDAVVRTKAWSEHVRESESELTTIQAEIDERCFVLYGIDEADQRAITEGFGGNTAETSATVDAGEEEEDDGEGADEGEAKDDATALAAELVAWAVGVAFGRFDLRLATGARPMPSEPGPFDPLQPCSPGMLTGDDGLPVANPPAGYPLGFPESGVLVDDPGHAHDLTAAVRAVFDVVFGVDADRWRNDVAALLDPQEHDLRSWLAGSFFAHHLKLYSKSRRKAPIFWQLATASGRYSVWLYAHRLTRDSFFQIQTDVVGPKLAHEERQLTSFRESAGGSPSASERRAIAAQEALVEELRVLLEEVKRVAPMWNPNLDDGVVLTMAPLWRLVPQYKPWQRELKGKWDELAAGKYDWAHLAMHLWPERVVPKCATDRSLAIAHGLEDELWVAGADGKWKSRSTPAAAVDELVRERASSAAKDALKSLLDAPVVSAYIRRRRVPHSERAQ